MSTRERVVDAAEQKDSFAGAMGLTGMTAEVIYPTPAIPVGEMRSHELPQEIARLDFLMDELEDYQEGSPERAVLAGMIEEGWQAVEERAAELGPGLHRWIKVLEGRRESAAAETKIASEEVARLRKWRDGWEKRLVRAKERTLALVQRCGKNGRLEGDTWRLRVQKNPGALPITHDGVTPIPRDFLAPVTVPARVLIALVSAANPSDTRFDAEIVRDHGGDQMAFDPEAVRAHIKEAGEIPEGFEQGFPTYHLRAE